MLKNMLQLEGVQKLSKKQLQNTAGGAAGGGGWVCVRVQNGVSHWFYGNQSSGSASAWVNAWGSMGWDAYCNNNAQQ